MFYQQSLQILIKDKHCLDSFSFLIMSRGRVSTQPNKFSLESEKIFRKNSNEIKACVEILNGIRMAESAAQKSHASETVNFKGNPFKDQDDNPRTENFDKKKSRYNR